MSFRPLSLVSFAVLSVVATACADGEHAITGRAEPGTTQLLVVNPEGAMASTTPAEDGTFEIHIPTDRSWQLIVMKGETVEVMTFPSGEDGPRVRDVPASLNDVHLGALMAESLVNPEGAPSDLPPTGEGATGGDITVEGGTIETTPEVNPLDGIDSDGDGASDFDDADDDGDGVDDDLDSDDDGDGAADLDDADGDDGTDGDGDAPAGNNGEGVTDDGSDDGSSDDGSDDGATDDGATDGTSGCTNEDADGDNGAACDNDGDAA